MTNVLRGEYKMTMHIMAVTYKPKIEKVKRGLIRQTIRKGSKFKVGDRLLLHGWEGRPYRTKWSWRREEIIIQVIEAMFKDDYTYQFDSYRQIWVGDFWGGAELTKLAVFDGIEPATGYELREVLKRINGPDWEGRYQIIRW